jgi:hypothetical protein
MKPIFVIHCANEEPCPVRNDVIAKNAHWSKYEAEAHLTHLDRPNETSWAKVLERTHPEEFARYKGTAKPAPCGPHQIVEYRPVNARCWPVQS